MLYHLPVLLEPDTRDIKLTFILKMRKTGTNDLFKSYLND